MSVCIQHQHIMSEYGLINCEYSNTIGNTVVSRTYCEHPLLGAANLLCEAIWSFPKMQFVYRLTSVSQEKRDQDLLKAGRNVAIAIVSH